jgi:hypothetical protein
LQNITEQWVETWASNDVINDVIFIIQQVPRKCNKKHISTVVKGINIIISLDNQLPSARIYLSMCVCIYYAKKQTSQVAVKRWEKSSNSISEERELDNREWYRNVPIE